MAAAAAEGGGRLSPCARAPAPPPPPPPTPPEPSGALLPTATTAAAPEAPAAPAASAAAAAASVAPQTQSILRNPSGVSSPPRNPLKARPAATAPPQPASQAPAGLCPDRLPDELARVLASLDTPPPPLPEGRRRSSLASTPPDEAAAALARCGGGGDGDAATVLRGVLERHADEVCWDVARQAFAPGAVRPGSAAALRLRELLLQAWAAAAGTSSRAACPPSPNDGGLARSWSVSRGGSGRDDRRMSSSSFGGTTRAAGGGTAREKDSVFDASLPPPTPPQQQQQQRDGAQVGIPGLVLDSGERVAAPVSGREKKRTTIVLPQDNPPPSGASDGSKPTNPLQVHQRREETDEMNTQSRSLLLPNVALHYRALYIFSPDPEAFSGRVRYVVFGVVDSPWFERVVLAVIICNSVTLALDVPSTRGNAGMQDFLAASEVVFQALFTIEMLVKMISLGFIMHPGSYLRNYWNVMDFIVVITGFVSLAPGVQNYSVLRLLRVVRPLRVVNRVPQMKSIMNALVQSLPGMRDVFLLLAFLIVMFAIVGVQLYQGKLHQRCYVTEADYADTIHALAAFGNVTVEDAWDDVPHAESAHFPGYPHLREGLPPEWRRLYNDTLRRSSSFLRNESTVGAGWAFETTLLNYTMAAACEAGWCSSESSDALPCSTSPSYGRQCVDNPAFAALGMTPVCRAETALYHDSVLNFDNFFAASLLVFKIISLDDWPLDMGKAQHALGWGMWMYFTTITVFGAFFCINLFLAVLSLEYYRAKVEAEEEEEERMRQEDEELHMENLAVEPAAAARPSDLSLRRLSLDLSRAISEDVASSLGSSQRALPAPPAKMGAVVLGRPTPRVGARAVRRSSVSLSGVSALSSGDSSVGTGSGLGPRRSSLTGLALPVVKPRVSAASRVAERGLLLSQPAAVELRLRLRRAVLGSVFSHFMLFVTCFNVLVLTLDFHNPPAGLESFVSWANFVCSLVFILELLLKLLALGPRGYFTEEYEDMVPTLVNGAPCVTCVMRRKLDAFNSFDFILVAISVPELVMAAGEGGSNFSAFRIFRLARMLRLLGKYPTLRQLLVTVIASVVAVSYLFLIMMLFVFIMGILGLQLFEGAFPEDSRENFDSLWEAFLTVFIVITGESWATIMKKAIVGTTGGAVLYFVPVFIFGNYMLINLFIAILIDEFMRTKEREDEDQLDAVSAGGTPQDFSFDPLRMSTSHNSTHLAALATTSNTLGGASGSDHGSLRLAASCNVNELRTIPTKQTSLLSSLDSLLFGEGRRIALLPPSEQAEVYELYGQSILGWGPTHPARLCLAGYVMHPLFTIVVLLAIVANVVFLAVERPGMDDATRVTVEIGDIVFTVLFTLECVLKAAVMGLYKAKSPAGVPKAYLTHRATEGTGQDSMGTWNRLDMFVVVTALVGIGVPQLKVVRSLRTVRLVVHFKGIRVVVMSLISALAGLANVAVVCLFLWLSFGIIAVQLFKGTFYYCNDPEVDSRAECQDSYFVTTVTPLGTQRLETPRVWSKLRYNFDNLGVSMLTLFEVAVGEGWAAIMYAGIDARGIDLNPKRNANPQMALFFCTFVVAGQFFAMNLFVGMLIDVFSRSKAKEDGSIFMTPEQREWVRANKMIAHMRLTPVPLEPSCCTYVGEYPYAGEVRGLTIDIKGGIAGSWTLHWLEGGRREPLSVTRLVGSFRLQGTSGTLMGCYEQHEMTSIRGMMKMNGEANTEVLLRMRPQSCRMKALTHVRVACFKVVTHPWFETIITLLIVSNVVLMCLEYYEQPKEMGDVLFYGNWSFVIIFTIEVVMKMLAVGQSNYFKDNWNKFDFGIVLVSYVGGLLGGPGLSVLRVLRIGRVFRLVKRAKNLQKLFGTLVHALPSLGNVSLLLLITFFIFGVVGVELFGKVEIRGNRGLTDYTNFKNIAHALITLYQVATTETWTDVLDGCMITEGASECSDDAGTCGTAAAIPYFVLFMLVGSFALLNLFVTIVLDEFNNLTESDDQDSSERETNGDWQGLQTKGSVNTQGKVALMDGFRARWLRLDPLATGRIRANQFVMLIRVWVASDEMQHDEQITDAWILKFFNRVAIPVDEDRMVRYDDAVQALLKELFQIDIDSAQQLGRFVTATQWRGDEYLMISHYFAMQKIMTLWNSGGCGGAGDKSGGGGGGGGGATSPRNRLQGVRDRVRKQSAAVPAQFGAAPTQAQAQQQPPQPPPHASRSGRSTSQATRGSHDTCFVGISEALSSAVTSRSSSRPQSHTERFSFIPSCVSEELPSALNETNLGVGDPSCLTGNLGLSLSLTLSEQGVERSPASDSEAAAACGGPQEQQEQAQDGEQRQSQEKEAKQAEEGADEERGQPQAQPQPQPQQVKVEQNEKEETAKEKRKDKEEEEEGDEQQQQREGVQQDQQPLQDESPPVPGPATHPVDPTRPPQHPPDADAPSPPPSPQPPPDPATPPTA